MTGILITKQNASGQSYYYIKLSYKDPISHKWRQKMIATHLEVKGNKRKAEALKNEAIANYAYLEMLPEEYNADVDPDITLCDYLNNWLHRKKANRNAPLMNPTNTGHRRSVVTLKSQIPG